MHKIIAITGEQSVYALMFEDAVNLIVDSELPDDTTMDSSATVASRWLSDIEGVIDWFTKNPEKGKELWFKKKLVFAEPVEFVLNEPDFWNEKATWNEKTNYGFSFVAEETISEVSGLVKAIGSVYPSTTTSVMCAVDNTDKFNGAHEYYLRRMIGLGEDNQAEYEEEYKFNTALVFVKREDDGSFAPGIQSEQLVIALLDRTKKLNDVYPSAQNDKMITGLNMFLEACQERVDDRISRGVMGKHEK